jgi:hypothetical protein
VPSAQLNAVSSWNDLATKLYAEPATGLSALIINGHGCGYRIIGNDQQLMCGVRCAAENDISLARFKSLSASDQKRVIGAVNARLKPGKPIVLDSCDQASTDTRFAQLQELANIFGRPVIANSGLCNIATGGAGIWAEWRPRNNEVIKRENKKEAIRKEFCPRPEDFINPAG